MHAFWMFSHVCAHHACMYLLVVMHVYTYIYMLKNNIYIYIVFYICIDKLHGTSTTLRRWRVHHVSEPRWWHCEGAGRSIVLIDGLGLDCRHIEDISQVDGWRRYLQHAARVVPLAAARHHVWMSNCAFVSAPLLFVECGCRWRPSFWALRLAGAMFRAKIRPYADSRCASVGTGIPYRNISIQYLL